MSVHYIAYNMKALILDAQERTAHIKNISKPHPEANEILVEVKAISLNPIDPLYVGNPLANSGRTIGSDFVGVVASLGSSVPTSSNLKVGDRVSGFLQGACSVNERPGAFAEFLLTDWDLVWKVPDDVTTEDAAGVSLVALTAAQGIWYRLGLQAPFAYEKSKVLDEHPEWVWNSLSGEQEPKVLNFFIYSSSTSVGLYAAQMIRLSAAASGRKIKLFGAASKAKWDLLKSEPYGYDHLVDYKDQNWPEQIRKLSGGVGMHYAYDCISEASSVELVSSTLVAHGRIAIVRSRAGGAWQAEELPSEPIYGAVWEGLGKEIQYQGFTVKESPAARAFAVAFYNWLSEAAGSKLKPIPIRLMPGGLDNVVKDGFRLLGAGTMDARFTSRTEEWMKPISAEKLVYKI